MKLSVSRAREQEVRAALAAHGIQVDEDADLVLTDGCPFEVITEVKAVYIDSVQVAEAQ